MISPRVKIPPRYADATLDGIPVPALQECVRRYGAEYAVASAKGQAPFFCGSTQGYKTYAAAVLAKAVNEVLDVPVGWVNCAADFARMQREAFEVATRVQITQLKRVPFLVLDDFTQAATNARQRDLLVEIGTDRFDALLPTLYTGNITLSARNQAPLADLVGACLARRILEASEGYRVLVKGTA